MEKRRIAAMLLCLLLSVSLLLSACTQETQPEESKEQVSAEASAAGPAVDSKYQDKDGNYVLTGLNKPAFNFTETEFRVCVYNKEVQTTYYSEEIQPDLYDTTDDVLNEAVRKRNAQVKTETGVDVVAYAVRDVGQTVSESIQGTLDLYDAAMPFMNNCTRLAQDGMLYNLYDFGDYLCLDAPWWDQAANESLSIANKLYFTVGDVTLMQKICANAVAFNKQIYRDTCSQFGDLYQIVRDGKWTIDLMHEMGKLATSDSDGEPGMTYKDTWGLFGSNGSTTGFYLAAGNRLIRKDNHDIPELALGADESSVNYAQKLLGMLKSGNDWFFNVQSLTGQVPDVWKVSVQVFGENRALFYGCAFSAIKKLRAYENMSDFGLLPHPKASEEQDTYYTPGAGAYAHGVCIPKDVHNPEFSAYMLDMIGCYAKNTITYAYYDVILKSRDSKDAESEEMLDQYIFNNLVYELGVLYDFGGISSMFANMMQSNSDAVVSELEARRSSVEIAIENCVELYQLDE